MLSSSSETYYVIGNQYKEDGLFSMYKHTIAHVIYAKEHGYVPVVDMRYSYNQYFKDGRAYKDNPWRYFFQQPVGIEPENIPQENNIIIAKEGLDKKKYQLYNQHLPLSKDDTRAKHPYLAEYIKYMRFSPYMQKYLGKGLRNIFNSEKDILGIIVRGTDFVEVKPKGHAIQPTAEMIIEKVKELQKTLTFKKIYLATEDANIYKKIKTAFGDLIIENNSYKYDTVNGKLIYQTEVGRKNHFYNLAKEYLLSVYLLSKCRYLIGGRANGALAAYIMTKGFETYDYVYMWDLGSYGDEAKALIKPTEKKIEQQPKTIKETTDGKVEKQSQNVIQIEVTSANDGPQNIAPKKIIERAADKKYSLRVYLFNFIPFLQDYLP